MQSASVSYVADTQMEHILGIYCCISSYPQNTVTYSNNYFLISHEFVDLECEQSLDCWLIWSIGHLSRSLDAIQFRLAWYGRTKITLLICVVLQQRWLKGWAQLGHSPHLYTQGLSIRSVQRWRERLLTWPLNVPRDPGWQTSTLFFHLVVSLVYKNSITTLLFYKTCMEVPISIQ